MHPIEESAMDELPVAVIGAGPIGLAAAANLVARGMPVRVFETGKAVGANLRDWAHVRIFTTWEQSVDPVSRKLLEAGGWTLPQADALPTGGDLCALYLEPLAAALGGAVETGARVVKIGRRGIDKVASSKREAHPFELRILGSDGRERTVLAQAVIDASGTWQNPSPLGGSGLDIPGEAALQDRIAYGMPDVLGARRARYPTKRIAVVGGGYSAINVLLDLVRLGEQAGAAPLHWVVRGRNMARIYGGGDADQLAARGRLGQHLQRLVESGRINLVTGFAATAIEDSPDGLVLSGMVDDNVSPPSASGRGDRGDWPASRPRHDARAASRARSLAGEREALGAADRSQYPFLRLGPAARPSGARASRARLLHDRRQELWPGADLPAADRL